MVSTVRDAAAAGKELPADCADPDPDTIRDVGPPES